MIITVSWSHSPHSLQKRQRSVFVSCERCGIDVYTLFLTKRRNVTARWTSASSYQSFRVEHPGLETFKPALSNGGRTLPSTIVLSTIDSTSCVDTRPYQTPDPCGVYICFETWEIMPNLGFRRVLAIQFPTYLCPPMCELFRRRARLESGRVFSVWRTCSSFSAGVPVSFSRGAPEKEGCSICVWTSHPFRSRERVKAGQTYVCA